MQNTNRLYKALPSVSINTSVRKNEGNLRSKKANLHKHFRQCYTKELTIKTRNCHEIDNFKLKKSSMKKMENKKSQN